MNDFSFLSQHFMHPFSTSHKLIMLRMTLLFIEMPIAASLFSLLLLLLLLLSEAAGLVLGFVAVYYSPHILHTYTRHFPTSWGVYSSFSVSIAVISSLSSSLLSSLLVASAIVT